MKMRDRDWQDPVVQALWVHNISITCGRHAEPQLVHSLDYKCLYLIAHPDEASDDLRKDILLFSFTKRFSHIEDIFKDSVLRQIETNER